MNLGVAARQRIRDWRTSVAFVAVIGVAATVGGTWISVAYPLLKGTLPFPQAERLAAVETLRQSGEQGGLSWMDLEDLRGGSVESIAGFLPRTWGLQTESHGHVEVVLSQQVTGDFFKVLGVNVALGELLAQQHEHLGNQAWVWFSHAAWLRFLGGQANPVNKVVWINNVPYRVGGVLPKSFGFPYQGESPDIYIPLSRTDYWNFRGGGGLGAIALLKPGVRVDRFQSELAVRATALASQFSSTNRDVRFKATGITSFLLGDRLLLLRWLMISVLLLLLVAMANAGGIWLAQWLRQQRRVSIQLCLGASKSRVWLEQAAEVLLLGGVASAMGVLGTALLLGALRAAPLFEPELARFELWQRASLNTPAAVLLILITLTTSLVSGMLPLLTVHGGAMQQLLASGRTATGRSSRRVRIALAVAQLTITGTLAYAGIMVGRNVQTLLLADRGFRTEQILVSAIGISETKYNTDDKMIRFHQQAIAELKRLPGVIDAAGGVSLPVSRGQTRFLVDGESAPREQQRMARIGAASPELLPILGIPLIRGRLFAGTDRWNSQKVALVNQAFVDRYLSGDRDPMTHRLRLSFYNGFAAKPYAEHLIVGVIGNTLNRDLATETEPQIVISSDQMAFEGFQYFLRSILPAAALKKEVQETIWRVDPEVQRVSLTPLVDRVESSLVSRRLLVWLLNVFDGIAILVVVFGLASTLSATFLEMTRELGIRSALGAPQFSLAFESVRWAVLAILLSELLTAPISIALGRTIILDRSPVGWDPVSWMGASAILGLIGIAAAFAPARNAASIDPAVTLRSD
jgi:predicted permease